MENEPQVRYEQEGRVARLVLNRPRYRNAQSRRLIEELEYHVVRAGGNKARFPKLRQGASWIPSCQRILAAG